MTNLKKPISILLALLLIAGVFAVVPITANAETSGDFTYEKSQDGIAKITGYSGSATELTIPSVIDGYTVVNIGSFAFESCSSLTNVTIPNSVTSIGASAFSRCTSLTSITIPDSVTSISDCAFWDCTSLTSVTIPEGVTSIGGYVFYGCTSLTSVTIPEGVIIIDESAFEDCTSLTSITIPEGVTSIGSQAFNGCSGLMSVTIPDSVTSIGEAAFLECTSLKSITIPASVTIIDTYAIGWKVYFSGYRQIESFTIYGYSGSAAETYANKNGITFIPLGDTPTEPVTTEPQPNTDKPSATVKKANPIKVSVKAKTVKLKKLKKKAQTVKAITIKDAQGKVSCKITKAAKIKKFLKINAKGVITFNKWKKAKKGTYNIKVTIKAAGNTDYKAKTITKTVKVKVK